MPHTVIVFRKPSFLSDSIISMYAGQLVHTDICPIDDLNGCNTLTCTCYIGESFSASLSAKRSFSDVSHMALAIPTSEQEQDRITTYLYTLVENNVRYNYLDVAAMALPTLLRNTLFGDIESEDPTRIQSLFCSQAAVLVLRNCLDESREVSKVLAKVNSRCVLPNTLYTILSQFAVRVTCESLREGKVENFKE